MRFISLAAFLILIGGACAPAVGTVTATPSSPARTARINDPARLPRLTATAAASPLPTATPVKPAGHTRFRVVSFVDDSLGWAAGSSADGKAFLLQTKDGGNTWSALPAPSAYITVGDELRFVDAQHGWLRTNVLISTAGDCGRPPTAPPVCRTVILHTSDGGHTWQEQLGIEHAGRLGPGLRALTVLDDRHAWVVRLGSVRSTPNPYSPCTPSDCAIGVMATSDGSTWMPVGDLPAFVDGMDFVDAHTGFATVHTEKNEVGTPNTASFVVTRDGGRTWMIQLQVDGPAPRLFVNFVDPRIGFALEREVAMCGASWCWVYGLYGSGDSGLTWNKVLSTPADISGAWWSPQGRFTTLATPMFISATVGWIAIARESDATKEGFMGGGVLITSDGGRSWRRTPAVPADWGEVNDLAVHGSTTWIVGQRAGDQDSFVARTRDRGQTWDYPPMGQP
ncbi:MAG: hypothetical protein M3P38_04035 [Chloroflexota bacterium]|nr:hypothetical protein [Chloroflexota bacterium]